MKPFGTPPNRPQSKRQKLNWVKPLLISGAVLSALGALGWFGYSLFYRSTAETDKPSSSSIEIGTSQAALALREKINARAALLHQQQNSGAISTHAIEMDSTAPTLKSPAARLSLEQQELINAARGLYNALDTHPDLHVDIKIKEIYNYLATAGVTYAALDPQETKTTAEMKKLINDKAKDILVKNAREQFEAVRNETNPNPETMEKIKLGLQLYAKNNVVDAVLGRNSPVPNLADENLPWYLLGKDAEPTFDRYNRTKKFGEMADGFNKIAKAVDVIREEITPSSEEEVGAPIPPSSAPVP
jgi:hypothetical protein